MAVQLSVCPYRLLFKRPFGTAHGLRTGTDALFVRAWENGHVGYGEITLPPYLKETIDMAMDGVRAVAALGLDGDELMSALLVDDQLLFDRPGCRAGVHTAVLDLLSSRNDLSARSFLGLAGMNQPVALMTLGICATDEVVQALEQLPASGALKVKVGDTEAVSRIQMVKRLDNRLLFLDGNQGMSGLEDAQDLAATVGADRLLGFEQPFATDRDLENVALAERTGAIVFADESVQDMEDLKARHTHFGGLNVKLMKCGGVDRALELFKAGRQNGMRIMLGSMSESSLGCTAMAQLSVEADIVDLDGPWLISNDPFRGIVMSSGGLIVPTGPGLGVQPAADLPFAPITS